MRIALLISEYYPQKSNISIEADCLAEMMKKMGYETILLSPSWCEVTAKDFYGSVDFLSQNKYYYKRFFVDPLQIREEKSCIFTALYSLACKILKSEQEIDLLIFSGEAKYIPIIKLLKEEYGLSIIYSINESNNLNILLGNSFYPHVTRLLKCVDALTGDLAYAKEIQQMFCKKSTYIGSINDYIEGILK